MRNPHFDEKGNFDLDKSIRGLVGALADPIIVMKGFESEPIPDWLRTRIKLRSGLTTIITMKGRQPSSMKLMSVSI